MGRIAHTRWPYASSYHRRIRARSLFDDRSTCAWLSRARRKPSYPVVAFSSIIDAPEPRPERGREFHRARGT